MNRLGWLERELEKDNLDPSLREKYDAEANAICDRMSELQAKNKVAAEEQRRLDKVAADQRAEEQRFEKERLDIQYVEESLHDLAIKIAGDNADQWLETALKLYTIDPNDNLVTSIAHGPEHPESWACDTYLDAKKKILQLIRYKYRDHFERGHDFFYYPEGEEQAS